MYLTLAHHTNMDQVQDRLTESQRPASPVSRGKRRGGRGVLAALVTAAALTLLPAVANAQTLNGVAINTKASSFTQVLDVSGASKAVGAPVIQWYSNGGANQRWNLLPDPNGYEHIVNVNSGLCLATNGVPGNVITQWPCSNSTQEDWSGDLERWSSTHLRNPASGLYLDVNGQSALGGTQLIAWYGEFAWYQTAECFIYTQY